MKRLRLRQINSEATNLWGDTPDWLKRVDDPMDYTIFKTDHIPRCLRLTLERIVS